MKIIKILKTTSISEYLKLNKYQKSGKTGISLKKQMYLSKGTDCVCCSAIGIEAITAELKGGSIWRGILTLDSEGREDLLTIDHINPKSNNGKNKLSNVQPMCYRCNQLKGKKHPEHFQTLIKKG